MEDQSYLYIWRSYLDISEFLHYIVTNGVDKLEPKSFNVVKNTIKAYKNDQLYLFCLLEKAKQLFYYHIKEFREDLDSEIDHILRNYNLSFKGQNLNDDKYYDIKTAWLLFLSQTENMKGKKLKKNFCFVPLYCASQILCDVSPDLQPIAKKMLSVIKSSQEYLK